MNVPKDEIVQEILHQFCGKISTVQPKTKHDFPLIDNHNDDNLTLYTQLSFANDEKEFKTHQGAFCQNYGN